MQRKQLIVPKFTIIITTRCNLRCKLCCEYVPVNKPFPDITLEQCGNILKEFFNVVDSVQTLHLSGGGEPFLHRQLDELVEECMKYERQFDRLMLFTNSTVAPSERLLDTLAQYKDKLVVQVSHYGIYPEREASVLSQIKHTGVEVKFQKYYGEDQTFGGWVDFGSWEDRGKDSQALQQMYDTCGITRCMKGNWRTRDGKIYWCSRSQRGTELGLIPSCPEDYIDLFDDTTVEQKRERFRSFLSRPYLNACRYCSGDVGTSDADRRYPAAEQLTDTDK